MQINLTIQKINNFFLILYGEISVLIGPIPRLFVTDAFTVTLTLTSCQVTVDRYSAIVCQGFSWRAAGRCVPRPSDTHRNHAAAPRTDLIRSRPPRCDARCPVEAPETKGACPYNPPCLWVPYYIIAVRSNNTNYGPRVFLHAKTSACLTLVNFYSISVFVSNLDLCLNPYKKS